MSAVVSRSFESANELGAAAAEIIAAGIARRASSERPYLLGCPGGRTPKPIYNELGKRCAADEIDCSRLVIVMMDDYLDSAAATPTPVCASAHYSCRRFAERHICGVINARLPASMRITPESVWFPDAADPSGYDERIRAAGGVDLFIVASGSSDGHVAFCGPGADLDGVTAVVELVPSTRADNMLTFPEFSSLEEVPTRGVSVGLGTIRHNSRSVLMVLHGPDKAESARRLETSSRYDPEWPATFVHECPNALIWTDRLASPDTGRRDPHAGGRDAANAASR